MDVGYPDFGRHLNNTGRSMIYSCSWPVYQIYAGISVSIIVISKKKRKLIWSLKLKAKFHGNHRTLQSMAKL